MGSVKKNPSKETKERKLSFSYLKKSLTRKPAANRECTSGRHNSTRTDSYVSNGQVTKTDCCMQHDRSHKSIISNFKRLMHLKGSSLFICQSKHKARVSDCCGESTSKGFTCCTHSRENEEEVATCPVQLSRVSCDYLNHPTVPDVISTYLVSNNDTLNTCQPQEPVLNDTCQTPSLSHNPRLTPTDPIADDSVCVTNSPDVSVELPLDCVRVSHNPAEDRLHETPDVVINVMDLSEGEEPNGLTSLIRELSSLAREGWYWGPISRQKAEEKLHGQPDGAFLVRDSSSDHYLLSISFRSSGKTLHARIEHNYGMFSFYAQDKFPTIAELIKHSMTFSRTSVYCYSKPRSPTQPSFPVRLTKPLSRFMQVRSLQYLCRFVIRQYTRFDNIQKLPLPKPIKGYVEEGPY